MQALIRWVLGPEPTIDDLSVLAAAPGADAHFDKLIGWRIERSTLIAKSTVGTSVSFLVTLLVAQFKAELNVPSGLVVVAVVAAFLIASFGVYALRALAAMDTRYPQLLYLLWLLGQ